MILDLLLFKYIINFRIRHQVSANDINCTNLTHLKEIAQEKTHFVSGTYNMTLNSLRGVSCP